MSEIRKFCQAHYIVQAQQFSFSTLFIYCQDDLFHRKSVEVVSPWLSSHGLSTEHTLDTLTHTTHVQTLRKTARVVFLLIACANFRSRVAIAALVQSFSWCPISLWSEYSVHIAHVCKTLLNSLTQAAMTPVIRANIGTYMSWPQLQPFQLQKASVIGLGSDLQSQLDLWTCEPGAGIFPFWRLGIDSEVIGSANCYLHSFISIPALPSWHFSVFSLFLSRSVSVASSCSFAFWGKELDSVWYVIKYSCLK